MNELDAVRNSALWAAHGDALGYLTELASESEVKRRTGASRVLRTTASKRRIGGKFGIDADLPAGVYSDDTQLRLATSRCIRADGKFDVEIFSKIELPVFLSYGLGVGNATRAAAVGLTRNIGTWSTNFPKGYVNAGGNGAAMRVQPHVWAARSANFDEYLAPVVRNSICTHGHPRGIVGAAFHAALLAMCIHDRRVPSVNEAVDVASALGRAVPEAIQSDRALRNYWIGEWERQSAASLEKSCRSVGVELAVALKHLAVGQRKPEERYAALLDVLHLRDRSNVGSATLTAVAAFALATYFDNPRDAVVCAANQLASDTDSIATMAGALLGAMTEEAPQEEVLDREYIASEAARCFAIQKHLPGSESFSYPDLLAWKPPENALGAVGVFDGKPCIAGLGAATDAGAAGRRPENEAVVWRWLRTSFGQTLLAKCREPLPQLERAQMPVAARPPDVGIARASEAAPVLFPLLVSQPTTVVRESVPPRAVESRDVPDLHELTRRAIDSGFDARLIGEYLLMLSERDTGIENVVAFAAIIAKAKKSRSPLKSRGTGNG